MDRLEKALEKSRQQRAALEAEQAERSERLVSASVGAAPIVASDSQELDEGMLEQNRIVAHRTRSPEADVYRQLRTKVLQIMKASGFKALAITSPNYKDGKTTVSVNLGISIALDLKQSVLLVDLDLRKPSLDQYLGLKTQYGLTDYLKNDKPLKDCLTRPSFERVSVLPAGSSLDNSSELLISPKMISLAQEIKNRYPDRIVIYDLPPVLLQDDPVAFMPQIDAVLVVVRDGVTKPEDLKRCLGSLSRANVIGTVLNNCW
ncbi:MAG: AAA family ATPase [Alphaproteobacteria bacterium]|nr:AAA family ATPase [Alphaproteobacteria bacterium]